MQRIRLEQGETWKAKALDLAERFNKSYAYHQKKDRIIYDCLTSGAKFIGRTEGEYRGEFSMWYRTSDGSVLECQFVGGRDIHIWQDMAEALEHYGGCLSAWRREVSGS